VDYGDCFMLIMMFMIADTGLQQNSALCVCTVGNLQAVTGTGSGLKSNKSKHILCKLLFKISLLERHILIACLSKERNISM